MARLPEQLGSLSLLRQWGMGRHCQVWEAVEHTSGQRVAVKVVVPEMARDAAERRQLRHELAVARRLDHPSIVRIDGFSTAGGLPHLVMELFPHQNLKQQLASGGTAGVAPRILRIVTQIAWALDHMHGRGWVHRDVKPTNILASPEGDAKLIDLAIATRKAGLLQRLWKIKTRPQGTLSYMAPEQIRGLPVDPRSDIYSLGCVFFELLAGAAPFTAASTVELRTKHLTAPPPNVEALNQNVTREAANLLREMMAKRPDDRPASMQAVAQRLAVIRLFSRPAG